MLSAIKLGMKYFNTKAFRKIRTRLIPDGKCSEQYSPGTDAYWRCYIESNTGITKHTVGTCRMGKGVQDQSAVVDSKLR